VLFLITIEKEKKKKKKNLSEKKDY
jgi:hypothetical protein